MISIYWSFSTLFLQMWNWINIKMLIVNFHQCTMNLSISQQWQSLNNFKRIKIEKHKSEKYKSALKINFKSTSTTEWWKFIDSKYLAYFCILNNFQRHSYLCSLKKKIEKRNMFTLKQIIFTTWRKLSLFMRSTFLRLSSRWTVSRLKQSTSSSIMSETRTRKLYFISWVLWMHLFFIK